MIVAYNHATCGKNSVIRQTPSWGKTTPHRWLTKHKDHPSITCDYECTDAQARKFWKARWTEQCKQGIPAECIDALVYYKDGLFGSAKRDDHGKLITG